MAIITISRGTFSGGQALAECIAEELGYGCVARQVLVSAAEHYGAPLDRLSEALTETPGFIDRLAADRAHYLAYVRATLSRQVKDDNVVYHGLAGHLLLGGLPHVVRVRVIAEMEFRIRGAMVRNKLSRDAAIEFIKRGDEKRVRWTRFLYHVDWRDPSLYDLVINLDHLNIVDACATVCCAAGLDRFKTTPHAQKLMDDMVLSTEVRAQIATNAADRNISDVGVDVEADDGAITIDGTVRSQDDTDKIKEIASKVPGVMTVISRMKSGSSR